MNAATPPVRRAAVVFIFFTMVMDVLGFGIIIPVLPKLVEQFMGGDAAAGARMYGWFGTLWWLMQFLFAPLVGVISDRFGRRPVILISCFGLGVDYVVMALAPNVAWLLAGRIVSGICTSSFSASGAYIADVSPPEKRAAAFGMMGAAFGIGFVVGPGIGGLLGGIDPRLPFWGAAGLALLGGLYGLFILPESLPAERRDTFSWNKANPVGSLKLLRSHPDLLGLSAIYFLFQAAHNVLPNMFVIYTGYRYGWDAKVTGLALMTTGIYSIIVQGGLVKPAVKYLGEHRALYVGLVFGVLGFAGFAIAPSAFWIWATQPVFALMGLFGPGIQSLMSKRVAPYEQGKLQGANMAVSAIGGMMAPLVFTGAFAWCIDRSHGWPLPGAPFFIAAGLLLIALLLALRFARKPESAPAAAAPEAAP